MTHLWCPCRSATDRGRTTPRAFTSHFKTCLIIFGRGGISSGFRAGVLGACVVSAGASAVLVLVLLSLLSLSWPWPCRGQARAGFPVRPVVVFSFLGLARISQDTLGVSEVRSLRQSWRVRDSSASAFEVLRVERSSWYWDTMAGAFKTFPDDVKATAPQLEPTLEAVLRKCDVHEVSLLVPLQPHQVSGGIHRARPDSGRPYRDTQGSFWGGCIAGGKQDSV